MGFSNLTVTNSNTAPSKCLTILQPRSALIVLLIIHLVQL